MPLIRVTDDVSIDESELVERFARASGPGGQHVNTTSSAVELRFDVAGSPSLSEPVKARLGRLAGRRLNSDGVLVLFSQSERSQELNRQEVRERLLDLIREATIAPKRRKATRPSRAAKAKRVEAKKARSAVKAMRGRVDP